MSKPLILIVTCEAYRDRADGQRATWVKDALDLFDVRFVRGGSSPQQPDEWVVAVDDGYHGLPAKVRAAMTLATGYEYVFKIDDDVLVRPQRLYDTPFRDYDYYGYGEPGRFKSGFCYSLSRRAVEQVANAELDPSISTDVSPGEDRWVNAVLSRDPTITRGDAERDVLVLCGSRRPKLTYITPKSAAVCEFFNAKEMLAAYKHNERALRVIKWQRR
jgi:hypothetical protein